MEASWFLIKPWILRIGNIVAQPSSLPSPRPSKLCCTPHGIASIYIRILTRDGLICRERTLEGKLRVRGNFIWSVDYPAVDLTFDGKLYPQFCTLDYIDFWRFWKFTRGNNSLNGSSWHICRLPRKSVNFINTNKMKQDVIFLSCQ